MTRWKRTTCGSWLTTSKNKERWVLMKMNIACHLSGNDFRCSSCPVGGGAGDPGAAALVAVTGFSPSLPSTVRLRHIQVCLGASRSKGGGDSVDVLEGKNIKILSSEARSIGIKGSLKWSNPILVAMRPWRMILTLSIDNWRRGRGHREVSRRPENELRFMLTRSSIFPSVREYSDRSLKRRSHETSMEVKELLLRS